MGDPFTNSAVFAKDPGIFWVEDNMKYEMLIMTGIIRKALKNRTFFLHLGVVQKKSACCQERPNSACCRYSHSEGGISRQTVAI